MKQLQDEVIRFTFPSTCIGCGRSGDFICVSCSKKLPRLLPPICQRCGKPEQSAQYCPECWKKQEGLDGIRSVFIFEGIIRTAIHELKYYNLRSISGLLGRYMADYFIENHLNGEYILPVPLHTSRLRNRGYNQSELLARHLSDLVNIPTLDSAVSRVVDNEPQTRTLSAEERRRNVNNIFRCNYENVRGKAIIIIDDVCTSGATLESCARTLKEAGATRAFGFTLAREVKNRS